MMDRVFTLVGHLAAGAFEGPEIQLRSGETVRSWPVHPFRVYYRRQAGSLQILRVYHQSRMPITEA